MNRFTQELINNNFVCSYCTKCSKFVWPPNELCNKCFGDVAWKKLSRRARLIEFSRKDNDYFCVAEFEEGMRVMGSIRTPEKLTIGQSLYLTYCNYDGLEKFVFETKTNNTN